MVLHFIGLDIAWISVLTGVRVCVGPMVCLETRAVTQAHLAYGIFLPQRGKHSGEARRVVKHKAQDRYPCGTTHWVDTHRGHSPMTS